RYLCPPLLLSFYPTRRSSDLPAPDEAVPDLQAPHLGAGIRPDRVSHRVARAGKLLLGRRLSLHGADGLLLRGRRVPGDLPPLARSEEHTSELQSRENLVCRLL